MSYSTPSPDDGQKFYDELLNKYQLFRTKNNLNVNIEGESNSDSKIESNNELKTESNSELENESNIDPKTESDADSNCEMPSNELNSPINDPKSSNVFIVEPDDQLLNELFDDNDLTFSEKLLKLKKRLQDEIDKETKIKDGSENLRKVSRDANILQHLNCILKQSNYRLNELRRDLNELNSYIRINSGQGESPKPQKKDSFDSYSDKEEETKNHKLSQLDVSKMRPDNISIASFDSISSPNTRILALEKQLDIEQKVKEGAENMLEMYSKNKNKKFTKEAKSMLEYSQAKIDYIRMMIDKIREHDKRMIKKSDEKSAANLNLLQFETLLNQNLESKKEYSNDDLIDQREKDDKFKNRFLQHQSKSSSCLPNNDIVLDDELINLINQEKTLNLRIEELKARLKLELTVMDGLKNIILTLQADKIDKSTIQDAKTKLIESYQKIYLLRNALKSIIDKLDSKSTKFITIDDILKSSKNVSTDLKAKSVYTSLPTDFNEREIDLNEISKQSQFSMLKTSAVCGKLEIKLIGIKNLLTRIERYDSDTSRSSSKSSKNYKVNSKIKSNEIKAVLKLDNIKVAETTWQNLKITDQNEYSNCFNCLGFFQIDLDRNRELEIQFYYNDFREFCAFKYLFLEDFVDSQTTNYELDLEPQGNVKFELRILNPMMIVKNNRLQRRKLLRFKSETFLRPNQLNINVAAWSRLMKNNVFEPSTKFSSTKSFASFTSVSSKKLSERSSSTESSSSSASQIKLEKQSTVDSFKEEDENELDESDDSSSDNIGNARINQDKLLFIKQLKEQKDQGNEIEIASLSSGEEEEIELIDMSVTEVDEPKNKGVFRSKTENLRAKPTMRKTKGDFKLDLAPTKQSTRIESIDSDDELSIANVDEKNKINTDNQPDIIELDDDLLISDYQNEDHPLSKFNLSKYEEKKDEIRPETKWETKELKLSEFSFVCTLGRGYFGKVLLSKHNPTNGYYAIKALKKKDVLARYEVDTLLNEKHVFLLANQHKHPFLIQLFACIQTKDHVCFVMESVMGGDLMHHINQEIFDEDRVVFYASSIVLCIEFLHKKNIIYRDLKLDNILLDKAGYIKLTDYGLCKELAYGQRTNTFCGTPDQIAPELLTADSYTNAVDWWALGIVIYQMMTGHSPFLGDDSEEIFDSIVNDEVIFPKYLSFESTVLIRRLLRKDPTKRLGSSPRDAEDVKKHSFFKPINFDDLYHKRMKAPFEPMIVYNEDVSNFEYEFTCRDPNLSFSNINRKLSDKDQKLFGSFDFISNEWKEMMNKNENNQKNKEEDKKSVDNNQTNLKEADQNDKREIQQLSDELSIENQSHLNEELKQSTGEKNERQTDSTFQNFKTEGNENEEIFVDLIERQDE